LLPVDHYSINLKCKLQYLSEISCWTVAAAFGAWAEVVKCAGIVWIKFKCKLGPGKVDSLFLISHILDFEAGGWSLFIIDYAEVIQPGAVHKCFPTKNYKRNIALQNRMQIRGRGTSKGQ